jgi:hypothetical protein
MGAAPHKQTHHFRRPSAGDEIDLTALFMYLDPEQVIALFASLLFERHVILASQKLSAVSACVRCAAALLHPFTWEHIFIPILPSVLLDFATAPMPFLVGIHSSGLPALKSMRLEESVVIIELETQQVMFFQEDLETIPDSAMNRLVSSLNKAVRKNFTSRAVQKSFVQFFASIFGPYHAFISASSGLETQKYFEERSLKDPQFRTFLETYMSSQMCEQWIKQREKKFDKEGNQFDALIAALIDPNAKTKTQKAKDALKKGQARIAESAKKSGRRIAKTGAEKYDTLRKLARNKHEERTVDSASIEDSDHKNALLGRLTTYDARNSVASGASAAAQQPHTAPSAAQLTASTGATAHALTHVPSSQKKHENQMSEEEFYAYVGVSAGRTIAKPQRSSRATARVLLVARETSPLAENPSGGVDSRHVYFVKTVEELREKQDLELGLEIYEKYIEEGGDMELFELAPRRMAISRDVRKGEYESLYLAAQYIAQLIAKARRGIPLALRC